MGSHKRLEGTLFLKKDWSGDEKVFEKFDVKKFDKKLDDLYQLVEVGDETFDLIDGLSYWIEKYENNPDFNGHGFYMRVTQVMNFLGRIEEKNESQELLLDYCRDFYSYTR